MYVLIEYFPEIWESYQHKDEGMGQEEQIELKLQRVEGIQLK